jgi:predicted nucleic acid-binding protein
MVVIADTSPLNYLILIGHVDVLPELYGEVVIPQAVLGELQHPNAPGAVARWIASPPPWMVVNRAIPSPPEIDSDLDAGEREAIALAQMNLPDVLLLIDENRGREEAERHNIQTTGTLGVLDAAAGAGLLELPRALEALLGTNFHVSSKIIQRLLDSDLRRNRARREDA